MSNLTILHDDNGNFIDLSNTLYDYGRDTSTVTFVALEDRLLIGYYKPFINPYVDIVTTDSAGDVTYKYYNGTSFVDLVVLDRSANLTRSGFLDYEVPSDWESSTIDGNDLYWVEVTYSADHITEYNGINTVFADDDDLREEYRIIDQFKQSSDPSFILTHQSVRKDIIQYLRNAGNYKIPSGTSLIKDVNQWDLLAPDEIRRAATYWALAKIFNNASDQVDGKFEQLKTSYSNMGKDALGVYLLTLDVDDDGKKENINELQPVRTGRITRI